MVTKIYVDGACSGNPGKGGLAVVTIFNGKEFQYSEYKKDTTNNEMELKAVMLAVSMCETIKDKFPNERHIFNIYSDSAYVVNSISENWLLNWSRNGWRVKSGMEIKHKEIWKTIFFMLRDLKSVKLIKVKGHSGNKYNELCDQLAVEAYKSEGKNTEGDFNLFSKFIIDGSN